jgi:hypothetical protein
MRRLFSILLLIGVLVSVFAPAVGAVEEVEDEGPRVTSDVEPAVVQDLFFEEEPDPPAWTYRFMIPLLITITLLAVVATTVQYFLRVVRSRYQPVE